MLEQLADHDDELLEQLLMDEAPAPEKIFTDLARETGENLGVSVLFGSALSAWGVRRLLKALRHEVPGPAAAADRLGVASPSLYVFKIIHGPVGRLALGRVLGGRIAEGSDLKTRRRPCPRSARCSGSRARRPARSARRRDGDIVAVAKVDTVKAGDWLGSGTLPPPVEIDHAGAQLRARDRARRPQGRRQAVGRAPAAGRGGSRADRRA